MRLGELLICESLQPLTLLVGIGYGQAPGGGEEFPCLLGAEPIAHEEGTGQQRGAADAGPTVHDDMLAARERSMEMA